MKCGFVSQPQDRIRRAWPVVLLAASLLGGCGGDSSHPGQTQHATALAEEPPVVRVKTIASRNTLRPQPVVKQETPPPEPRRRPRRRYRRRREEPKPEATAPRKVAPEPAAEPAPAPEPKPAPEPPPPDTPGTDGNG